MNGMNRKGARVILFVVALVVVACVIVLLSNVAGARPIKIGLAATLTGPYSTSGTKCRNAVVLAVEEVNAKGGVNGRPVELIIKDDKADPNVARQVDQELVDEGAVAVIGHYLSTLSVAAAPVMNEAKVVMLATGTRTSDLTGKDDYFMRMMVPLDRFAQVMATMAFERLGLRRMVVVHDLTNPSYCNSWLRHFGMEFEKKGGKILATVGFEPGGRYSAPDIARQVKDTGADGVFLVTNSINGALICQHLARLDTKVKVVDSSWAIADPDFITNGGRATNGVASILEAPSEPDTEALGQFKERYERRFGQGFGMVEQLSYEAAQILFTVLSKTDDPVKLKQAIVDQRVFQGLDGKIMVDEYGDPLRDMHVLEIQDGRIVTLDRIPIAE